MAIQAVRIAMLNTDMPVPNVRSKLGTYGDIFHRLLVDAASRISPIARIKSANFDVIQGEYPGRLSDFDAIIITGSAASAYDDAEWIRKLDAYVLDVYQNHPRIKMFGSCFGHQLVCQSLFRHLGIVVEKDPKGWELGVHEIVFSDKFDAALRPSPRSKCLGTNERPLTPDTETSSELGEPEAPESLKLQFVHADHVKIPHLEILPRSWMVVGSSKHCAVQGVYKPGRVLTLQGHFEFDRFVNSETIKVFGALWEPEKLKKALEHMDADDDADRAADIVARFLMADLEKHGNYDRAAGLITPPVEVS
ncbi:putative Glutamine amidotransferase domain-containing protein [Seiridium cardinale]|uniref:Glutamine amidotransferase domain-containing protein n=1 Tax=Seiridium cardinale TaxID=138064 RepID=A0ABR2XGG0_9PEZI